MTSTSLREIRSKLLAQHADIRVEIAKTRDACDTQPLDTDRLNFALASLVAEVLMHNVAEEEALHSILPDLDVFGAVRKEVMLSDHTAEHREMLATLEAATSGQGSAETVASVRKLLDRLLSHMEHKENLFLSKRLLD